MPRIAGRGRVDANHWEVFSALKRTGWCVISTADLGSGFPDIVAAKAGVVKLIEVKDGKKPPSARKLTRPEQMYHAEMAAAGCPITIIETLEQVEALNRDLLHGAPETSAGAR